MLVMMKSKNNHLFSTCNRGFTLLEVMISLAILAIGLVTVMQLFSSSLRNAKVSQDYTKAIFAARQMLEEIMVTQEDFEGFEDSGEFEDLPDFFWEIRSELYEPEEIEGDERYSLQPEETDGSEPITDTYKIDFKVTWSPSGDKRKSFTLTTLKIVHRRVEEF
jgi:general secretion pathway protein I